MDPDLKKKLEQYINRIKSNPSNPSNPGTHTHSQTAPDFNEPSGLEPAGSGPALQWSYEIPGSIVSINDQGSYIIIEERYPPAYLYGGSHLARALDIQMNRFSRIFDAQTAQAACETALEDYIFLDTETTGLSTGGGTVAFLVGTGFFDDGAFVLRQYFMRDYDDEPAMLFDLLKEFSRFKGVVSFNGRAFDWNLLHSRLVYNRMGRSLKRFVHLDLLYPSRRIWKAKLESCSLSSLEENILGEFRAEDIPGAYIPSAYFRYLENRRLSEIKKILQHNQADILAMVALMSHINALLEDPVASASDETELYGLARAFEAGGGQVGAVECFEACIKGSSSYIRDVASKRLSWIYKRSGNYEKAVSHWEELLQDEGSYNIFPAIELAKYYEHRAKDLHKALLAASKAMQICLGAGMQSSRELDMLSHRIERLKQKISRVSAT